MIISKNIVHTWWLFHQQCIPFDYSFFFIKNADYGIMIGINVILKKGPIGFVNSFVSYCFSNSVCFYLWHRQLIPYNLCYRQFVNAIFCSCSEVLECVILFFQNTLEQMSLDEIDQANGVLMPVYDGDVEMIYLIGKVKLLQQTYTKLIKVLLQMESKIAPSLAWF